MKKSLLLVLLIPLGLLSQDRSFDGIYSTTEYRTAGSRITDSSTRLVVAGNNPAGIKISKVSDRYSFPQQLTLNVYPNPAISDTRAVFSSNEFGLKYSVSVISLEGKPLMQKTGTTVKGTNIVNFSMSPYPTGSYFLQLFVGTRKETAQFLKVVK
jgi:hypothetical protein